MRVALIAPFGLRPKGTTIARALPIARVLAEQGAQVRLVIPPWDDPSRAGEHTQEAGVDLAATLEARVRTVAADGLSAERETNSVGTDKR